MKTIITLVILSFIGGESTIIKDFRLASESPNTKNFRYKALDIDTRDTLTYVGYDSLLHSGDTIHITNKWWHKSVGSSK